MKRLWLLASLVLVCAGAPAGAPSAASAAYSGDRMMDVINWARAQAGQRPLKRSRRLVHSAAARSELMMGSDFFAHPSRLSVPSFDRVGEVLELHRGVRPRVMRTFRRWAASPGHREILSSRRYRWIGAARATGRFNGRRATIWVVRFGRR